MSEIRKCMCYETENTSVLTFIDVINHTDYVNQRIVRNRECPEANDMTEVFCVSTNYTFITANTSPANSLSPLKRKRYNW